MQNLKNGRINVLSFATATGLATLSVAELALYNGLRVKSKSVKKDGTQVALVKRTQLERHLARIRENYPAIASEVINLGVKLAKDHLNSVNNIVYIPCPHNAVEEVGAPTRGSILGNITGNEDAEDGEDGDENN